MVISVICPTYNRANFISQAIDSFIAQDYKKKEMIVVLDGCTDNTLEVISKYESESIKIINRMMNCGQMVAQNYGVEVSTGDLVCTLDDDDMLYDAHSLSVRASEFAKRPSLDMLWSSAVDVRPDGSESTIHITAYKTVQDEFRQDNMFINSVMVRRSLIDRMGYFNDVELTSNEDWDFKVRAMICAREYDCIPDITVKHRVWPGMRSDIHRRSGELQKNEGIFKKKLMDKYGDILNGH
jgi:glycosyltransferase involved in cell wall biosynthesis